MVRGAVACAAVSVALSALGCGSTDELRACGTGVEQMETETLKFDEALATDPSSVAAICPLVEGVQAAYSNARQLCELVGAVVEDVPAVVTEQEANLCKQYLSCSAAVRTATNARETFDTAIDDTTPAVICPAIETLEGEISNVTTECNDVDEVPVPTDLQEGLDDAKIENQCEEFSACTRFISLLEGQLPLLEEALHVDPNNSSSVCAAYSPVNETLASAPADCAEFDLVVVLPDESVKQSADELCTGARCEESVAKFTSKLNEYNQAVNSGEANETKTQVCEIISDLETHEAEAAKTCSQNGGVSLPQVDEIASKKLDLACDEIPAVMI